MNPYLHNVRFTDFLRFLVVINVALAVLTPRVSFGQRQREPEWIWSHEHKTGQVPFLSAHFRKTFYATSTTSAQLQIAADDAYEVFVNGQRIATGESWEHMDVYEISEHVQSGRNLIAVKVTNRTGDHAGLSARIDINEERGHQRTFVTDRTWRVNLSPLPLWYVPRYNDRRWNAARSLGPFSIAEPWASLRKRSREESQHTADSRGADNETSENNSSIAKSGAIKPDNRKPITTTQSHPRFRVLNGFQVQHVVSTPDSSLIAMAFNEFGDIVASQENGPLLLIEDKNGNGVPESTRVYCDLVKNCQGILPLSGSVYVVGDGPQQAGLYRLEDKNRDGILESVNVLVEFEGEMGEHGPHGLVLGPDGLIYVAMGNHTKPKRAYAKTSPLIETYEGNLQEPRYEDPTGHADGVKSPGGAILRIDTRGKRLELVAAGLRNSYDLSFNRQGELFVHDSDMESDLGTSWHRPTRLLHVVPGAEFGWRSGWAKWPDYYLDSLPGLIDTGRGSPTGLLVYDHTTYPEAFQGVVFTCDWSQGRIETIQTREHGSSYVAGREVFLEGQPLNVSDIDVGPEGYIYFSTGGRGTQGHIYRIAYRKTAPKPAEPTGVARAVSQPQLHSAWGRQSASTLRQTMGQSWDREILKFVGDQKLPGGDRARGLELMHLVGLPHQ